MVPVFHKQQLPSSKRTANENGRLFNVYLRPWVLDPDDATEAVPHASHLGIVATSGVVNARSASGPPAKRVRLVRKHTCR